MRRKPIEKKELALSALLMLAMSLIGFLEMPLSPLKADMGLFLPSPAMWNLNPWVSWGINNFILLAAGIAAIFLNKSYNFVKSPQPVGQIAFFLTAGSNVLVTSALGASSLLLAANFLCFSFIFDAYRKRNATQEFFIVATIIALGSMVQYAFLMMIPVFIIAGFILQAMRIREFLAFVMGLVAPFWVGFGLGLLSPADFKLPVPSYLFSYPSIEGPMAPVLLNVGLTALVAFLSGIDNVVRLYAGNSRVLAFNNVISIAGLAACAGIIIDFNNMSAYLAVLYFSASYQTANLFPLRTLRRGRLLLTLTAITYAALFAASILI